MDIKHFQTDISVDDLVIIIEDLYYYHIVNMYGSKLNTDYLNHIKDKINKTYHDYHQLRKYINPITDGMNGRCEYVAYLIDHRISNVVKFTMDPFISIRHDEISPIMYLKNIADEHKSTIILSEIHWNLNI